MTTTIPARRLTADHHGCFACLPAVQASPAGTLTDTLIGEEAIDLWLNGRRYTVPGETAVVLQAPDA